MKKTTALLLKEWGGFFKNPYGYIVITIFGAFANFLFIKDLFLRDNASMRSFFELTVWLLILFVPALTMRTFASEKKSKTLEVLLSLPVSERGIVLAKYGALVLVGAITLISTISLPITLSFISQLYIPVIVTSYVGLLLVMYAFVAVSVFFSSLTSNQIVAFLSSVLILFLSVVVGSDFMSGLVPRVVTQQLVFFSPLYHLDLFLKGIIDARAIFSLGSVIVLFLFMTVIIIERRD